MHQILLGIKRDWFKFIFSAIFGYTFLWSLLEPAISFLKADIYGWPKFIALLLISLIIAIIRVFPKKRITIPLKNTNTKVNISFGDIFKQPHNIAISVNEYFDSKIGKLVSPKSLHGMLIEKIIGGKSEIFDNCINKELLNVPHEINQRTEGNHKRYPIGTTATLPFGDKKYLLFALCHTNEEYKASATPVILLEALDGLWKKARVDCNGYAISIPLIGTGLAGIGLPPMRIIDLILVSILIATKSTEITSEINVVIHSSMFDEVNLDHVLISWR